LYAFLTHFTVLLGVTSLEDILLSSLRQTSDIESFILLIIIYSVVNLNISKGFSLMDTRLLVIAGPLLIAASWALVNIGRLALQQLQRMK
jgi:hypothetical protein